LKRDLVPAKKFGGELSVPGDKSIAHRAALFSILSQGPITIKHFPGNDDCARSLDAARAFGVEIEKLAGSIRLTPPDTIIVEPGTEVDCGNSGTTARLLAGIAAGLDVDIVLTGDDSLCGRPMKRIIDPLSAMGATLESENGCLPLHIRGKKLLPFEYRLPIPSAQVKSAVLLAALASRCSVKVQEEILARDHTERLIGAIGEGITIRDITAIKVQDPEDPRKQRLEMPEDFKRESSLTSQSRINGGEIDIPGDLSTAAFFMAGAAISKTSVTIDNVGINPTRSGFIDHLKSVGCTVEIDNKREVSGEPRATVTVSGGTLKPRRVSGEATVRLIDELPIVAVMAAFADGTTVIRDAGELRVKESDRIAAVAENLARMGVKCGILEDGLAIEGAKERQPADFSAFGDHRIAMAFAIAAQFLDGPSTLDDDRIVAVSCPEFFDLLESIRS
jgi:3-phosphoshikimate 1-carboxyvinyltransferase